MMTPEKMEKLQRLMNTKFYIDSDTGNCIIQENNVPESMIPPEINEIIEKSVLEFIDEMKKLSEKAIIDKFKQVKNNLTPSEITEYIDEITSDLHRIMTEAGEPSDKVEEFVEHVRDMLSNS